MIGRQVILAEAGLSVRHPQFSAAGSLSGRTLPAGDLSLIMQERLNHRSRRRARMLVVTRKKDEKLIIGNEIEIQVLRIGRDNVRLGIKAPSHISIYRYEIYEAIKQENLSAVKSQIPDKDTLEGIGRELKPDAQAKNLP
jgi:carbon storage regulator